MKSLRILGIGLLAVIPFLTMKAQKAMTPQDLQDWKRITTRAISDDGQWAAAMFTPWKGDSEVQLWSVDGKAVKTYSPASEVRFSSGSRCRCGMSRQGLGSGNQRHGIGKHTVYSLALAPVIVGCPRSVCIDIGYVRWFQAGNVQ